MPSRRGLNYPECILQIFALEDALFTKSFYVYYSWYDKVLYHVNVVDILKLNNEEYYFIEIILTFIRIVNK